MAGYFKFLNSADVHYVMDDHTLMLSTPKYFHDRFHEMEDAVRDPKINDPNEARTIGLHDPIIREIPTEQDKQILASMGVVGNMRDIVFIGGQNIITHPRQVFILSFTHGSFNSLAKVFASPPANYDACLKINRFKEFISTMCDTALIDGKPVKSLCSKIGCDYVRYESIFFKTGLQPPSQPSAFKKDPSFSNQREVRVVFTTKEELKEQRLVMTFPRLPEFMTVKRMGNKN
jgi:hypothetical protein